MGEYVRVSLLPVILPLSVAHVPFSPGWLTEGLCITVAGPDDAADRRNGTRSAGRWWLCGGGRLPGTIGNRRPAPSGRSIQRESARFNGSGAARPGSTENDDFG